MNWDTLFLYHVYVGDEPAFDPVAVKVTVLPEQTELDNDAMETEGETLDVTESVTPTDEAVVTDRQTGNVPPTERTAATTSPLLGE